ncbi:MAG: NAD(P)H-binding protein [Blastochloris sp.]|jgi:NADH dehydrogenase|nr:NAD(P)H-binding protein [Blastochloris sp.]
MILVTGGTGFVGREIVKQLLEAGHHVRVLVRDPAKVAQDPLFQKCDVVPGDILNTASLPPAMQGVKAVIHLVGVIFEHAKASFTQIHAQGTANMAAAARIAGVSRFLHMSAINTRATAASRYHQSKWQGELAVRQSGLDWTIFQPSVIYGPGDGFVNRFADLMMPPLCYLSGFSIPVTANGDVRLQPVHVREVASAFVRALANENSIDKTYELGGAVISLKDFMIEIALALRLKPTFVEASLPALPFIAPIKVAQGYRPVILPVPEIFFRLVAGTVEIMSPIPILTYDQAIMLEESHYADTTAAVEDLGFQTGSFSEGLREYLGK